MQCETLAEWVPSVEREFDISVEDDVLDDVNYKSLNQLLQTRVANASVQSLEEFVAIFGTAKCIKYTQTQTVEGIMNLSSRTVTRCSMFRFTDVWDITLTLVTVLMAGSSDNMWFDLDVTNTT